MRVAALAFGVLAGLVASLVFALGGLDVGSNLLGEAALRQAQAVRFGLLVVGNLGIFGAGLVLASPIGGAIFLLLGAVAWVGAALLTQHSTNFVLYTPPVLLLAGAAFAFVAHFRRRPANEDEEAEEEDVEIMPPLRSAPMPSAMMDDDEIEEAVAAPAFASRAQQRQPEDAGPVHSDADDWNPRRRQPPPPRTKPTFRSLEDDYDDEEEPSGISRFFLGASGVLSFGLYAGLAVVAVLVFWTLRDRDGGEAAIVVAETSSSSSIASPPSAPPVETRLVISSEPVAPAEQPLVFRDVTADPAPSPAAPVEIATADEDDDDFGEVVLSSDPTQPPSLISRTSQSVAAAAVEAASAPLAPAEPSAEPPPVELAPPPAAQPVAPVATPAVPAVAASVAAAGQPLPRPLPLGIVVARERPALGASSVATQLIPAPDAGL